MKWIYIRRELNWIIWIICYTPIQSNIINIDKVNLHLPQTFLILYSWASQSNNTAELNRLTKVQQHTQDSPTMWGTRRLECTPILDEERLFQIDPQLK